MDFKSQINALSESYHCNLNTFKEAYILTKLYPSDTEYTQKYAQARNNLVKLSRNLFLVNNELHKEIQKQQEETEVINDNIQDAKRGRDDMNKQNHHISGNVQSAMQMSSDYNKLYVDQYLSNVAMFLVVVAAGGVYYAIFKKPTE